MEKRVHLFLQPDMQQQLFSISQTCLYMTAICCNDNARASSEGGGGWWSHFPVTLSKGKITGAGAPYIKE